MGRPLTRPARRAPDRLPGGTMAPASPCPIVSRSGRPSPPATRASPGPHAPGSSHRLRSRPFRGGLLRRRRVRRHQRTARRALRASLGCGNPVAVAELQPGRNRAGPRLRRRDRRAAVRPPRRPRREGLRPGRLPGHDHPGPRERRPGRRHQRGVPARPHRGHPAARRPRRRGHLQLRDQPVRRQAPRTGRGVPGAPPGRAARDQRRHRRRRPRPGTARGSRAADRLHHRDPHRR